MNREKAKPANGSGGTIFDSEQQSQIWPRNVGSGASAFCTAYPLVFITA